MSETGLKETEGKLQWDLVPWSSMESVVRVLMNGAKKYAPGNWMKEKPKDYVNACMRHLEAYMKGDKVDVGPKGDNEWHLAHLVCDALFLIWFDEQQQPVTASRECAQTASEEGADELHAVYQVLSDIFKADLDGVSHIYDKVRIDALRPTHLVFNDTRISLASRKLLQSVAADRCRKLSRDKEGI